MTRPHRKCSALTATRSDLARPGPHKRAVGVVGDFVAFFADTVRAFATPPFQTREVLEQVSFIAGVSILPTITLTIPFCVIVIFLLNQLLIEVGATDLAGAGTGLAVIREIGPIASVLVVAGAGATAICADLGARVIREEIDAMRVLGIDPIQRLVVPRVIASTTVSFGLNGLVSVVGIIGGYVFSVLVQHASPGLFVSNLTLLVNFQDFVVGEIKAASFGFAAGVVACFRGLRAAGGPLGVGEAVNQTVIYSFMVLFFFNTLITTIALQFTPS
jgi:phospholipid/cholesterol/gamma-HCH transport system permease protein